MQLLYLQNNQLTGEIDLTRLPDGMYYLNLDGNHLTGPLVIKVIPPTMRVINARRNQFNAVAVVESETNDTIKLEISGVTSVVNENGNEVHMQRFLC